MSEINMKIEDQIIQSKPTPGVDNKVLVTPNGVWFWPFSWENLDDSLEHYKIENELVNLGLEKDMYIPGYLSEGKVKLFDWREELPEWAVEQIYRNFENEEVYLNDSPLS